MKAQKRLSQLLLETKTLQDIPELPLHRKILQDETVACEEKHPLQDFLNSGKSKIQKVYHAFKLPFLEIPNTI